MSKDLYPEYEEYQNYCRIEDEVVADASGSIYDAFENAQSAHHYLNAPPTIMQSASSKQLSDHGDISVTDYFHISPLANLQDPVSVHFMTQTSIADAKGFQLLSYQELEDIKKKCGLLGSKISELEQRLNMELKVRDAALSLSKLQSSGSSQSSQQRKSFLFSNSRDKKRVSKHVEEELEISNRKIEALQREIPPLALQKYQLDTHILQHHVACLAITHQSSESASSSKPLFSKQATKTATSRMISRLSGGSSSSSSSSLPRSSSGGLERDANKKLERDARKLDSLISRVSSTLASRTTSPGVPAHADKLDYLSDLCDQLRIQLSDSRSELKNSQSQLQSLVVEIISSLSPGQQMPQYKDFTELRSLALTGVDEFQRELEQHRDGESRLYADLQSVLEERLNLLNQHEALQNEHLETRNHTDALQMDHEALLTDYQSVQNAHNDLALEHQTLTESHQRLEGEHKHVQKQLETLASLQQESQEMLLKANQDKEIVDILEDEGTDEGKVKTLLKHQIESLTASYEANRSELEQLELENVDLKSSLRESKFASQAEIQQLNNEIRSNQERVQEWKERCEALRTELESVVRSLEDVTRQAVDYEDERTRLERTVQDLQNKLFQESNSSLDKRVSSIAQGNVIGQPNVPMTPAEPTSVSIMRHEFRKIIMEINAKHMKEIKQLQADKKKLEHLLRSIKTSSYMAGIPPEKLKSLGIVEAL
jgi:hypothetical protein